MDVPTTSISERYEYGRSVSAGRLSSNGRYRSSVVVCLSPLMLLAIAAYVCSSLALWAQTPDSQGAEENKSWTATTDSSSDNAERIRTTESHTHSGNRTLDKQSVERRSSDGGFVPYQDIEKETVQVDAATVRTSTRTFAHDADGGRTLVEVVEEEKRTLAGGDSNVVRSTSDPDVNGDLQLVRRQIEETKKLSPNVEDTKTTVLLPDVNGGLAPAVKVHERREQGANGTIDSQETTLLPDGAGNWAVGEIRRVTTRQDGDQRSTDEQVSRPDSEGKLGEVSRTVSNEAATAAGDKSKTVETYSVSIPGAVGDGSLHLVKRAITSQLTSSTGQQVTRQQVEQANPGDPGSGLQVTTVTLDTVRPGASGAQATRTIQARDANGSLPVISVDTTKSDNLHAIQIQIAPSGPPK
jgi:CheY-like chemotaxis protein